MFDFITKIDLFPILPWWLEFVAFALAAYAVYRRRTIFFFIGKVLMPKEISQRWNALATKVDVNDAKGAIGNNVVERLTQRFVERLPELLSKDFTTRVKADVAEQLPEILSDRLIDRVLAALPEAMEQRAQKTIANLSAQVNALRMQVKGNDGWGYVGVHVRGFKIREDDKEEYFAVVECNFRQGGIRAAQIRSHRVLVPKSRLEWSNSSPFYGRRRMATTLGAPWYGKVNGDPNSIVMCGEAYTLYRP